jgi:hypothetical protein
LFELSPVEAANVRFEEKREGLGSFGPGRPKMDNRAVINVRFQSASAFCMLYHSLATL